MLEVSQPKEGGSGTRFCFVFVLTWYLRNSTAQIHVQRCDSSHRDMCHLRDTEHSAWALPMLPRWRGSQLAIRCFPSPCPTGASCSRSLGARVTHRLVRQEQSEFCRTGPSCRNLFISAVNPGALAGSPLQPPHMHRVHPNPQLSL